MKKSLLTSTILAAGALALYLALPASGACTVTNSHTLSATTWADAKSCHTSAADDATPAIITLSSGGVISMDSQWTIDKHVHVVCSGTCTLRDDAFTGQQASGAADSTIVINESPNGAIQFGGTGFVWNNAGDTSHASPSGVIYVQSTEGGVPVQLLGINMPNTSSGRFGGNMIIMPPRGLATGFDITADAGGGICGNGTAFIRIRADTISAANPWLNISKFGNADTNGDYNLYIEKNTISRFNEMIDVKESARVVFRYNTVTNSGFVHHGSDTEPWAARYSEIYGNVFARDNTYICDDWGNYVGEGTGTSDMNGNTWISLHGGTSIIHSNDIPCYNTAAWGHECGDPPLNRAAFGMIEEQMNRNSGPSLYGCWGTPNGINATHMYYGYPIPSQLGWGWVTGSTPTGVTPERYMDLEPIYVVNNTGGSPSIGVNMYVAGYPNVDGCNSSEDTSMYVALNREYYNQVDLGSFDGTSGASQGPRSSRPSSSTNGIAYWSNNQGGNWKTKNIDGSDNMDANDGCLDKVVSGMWQDCWYTPYPFPYSADAGSPPPPPAPTGKGRGQGRGRLR